MNVKEGEEVMEVKVIPEYSSQDKRGYSNYLLVSHDENGFVLTFGDNQFDKVTSKANLAKDADGNYIVRVPIVAQIIVSPVMIPKILDAIKSNFERYSSKQKKDPDGAIQG